MGKFIVIEGGPGSGKTTQIKLLAEKLGWLCFREPGGTEYGEAVREVLQEKHELEIDKIASVFGYMTCRANLIFTKIFPALKQGKSVLLDRYWTSTYAYQGAEGFNKKDILTLSKIATDNLLPDLFIYYDVDTKIGQLRKNINKQQQDRYDVKDLIFFNKVRKNYLELKKIFGNKWCTIDAGKSVEEIHNKTMDVLRKRKLVK